MSDNALIKAQDNILSFLMEGPKGRNDFWLDDRFKRGVRDERGIYPSKTLHIMKDAFLLEKSKVDGRVQWKILDGAFFRMSGKEYTWSYQEPEVSDDPIYVETDIVTIDVSIVDDKEAVLIGPVDEMLKVENEEYPYLNKAKEALKPKPRKWLRKLRFGKHG